MAKTPKPPCGTCEHRWVAHEPTTVGTFLCGATIEVPATPTLDAYSYRCPCPNYLPAQGTAIPTTPAGIAAASPPKPQPTPKATPVPVPTAAQA